MKAMLRALPVVPEPHAGLDPISTACGQIMREKIAAAALRRGKPQTSELPKMMRITSRGTTALPAPSARPGNRT